MLLTLHSIAKNIWLEVVTRGDPEYNGGAYNADKDGFIKVIEQSVICFCPNTNATLIQLKAMPTPEFKFARGKEVAAHATRLPTIFKYAERLLGEELIPPSNIKLLTYNLFPNAWNDSFIL